MSPVPRDPFTTRPTGPRPDDPVVQVVVVCHANIARSPLAMVLLEAEARRRVGRDAPVWVRSAGVHAVVGSPAATRSREEAAARGLDLSSHRAEQLVAADVADADLVVTMTERQRDHAARLVTGAAARVFSLVELARLCRALPDGTAEPAPVRVRIRDAVGRAHALRATVPAGARPEDVDDPYGGPDAAYARMAREVERLVRDVARPLLGPVGESA